jgi:hypothetical protein
MRKREELANPDSCLNRATEGEMLFVLKGNDVAAPNAIRAWCTERIRMGKNEWNDSQIAEALRCADTMDMERPRNKEEGHNAVTTNEVPPATGQPPKQSSGRSNHAHTGNARVKAANKNAAASG